MTEPDWRQLENSLDFAHALETAGRGPMRRMTRRLTRDTGVHDIESVLRQEFMEDMSEIAGWLPVRWKAAVTWLAELPYLRAHAARAEGGELPDWLDPGDLHGPEPGNQADAARVWRREWARRAGPAGPGAVAEDVMAPMFRRHLDEGTLRTQAGWAELERHFLANFRAGARHRGASVAAVFAFVGLTMIDAERLRGILVGHAVFAGTS